jgi:L-alanine-DL-glutamate epimerase-like enolase superfamily enzyme
VVRIIKKNAADIINVRLSKVGGLHNAKKAVAIAEAAGVPCLVGAMLELGLGTAAKLHLAASSRNVRYASEFSSLYYARDLLTEPPMNIENGFLKVPQGPGLGVELDERKLELYATKRINK